MTVVLFKAAIIISSCCLVQLTQATCLSGTHGSDCSLKCSPHCVTTECSPENGTCTHGCEFGWGDHNCTLKCPWGFSGDGCLYSYRCLLRCKTRRCLPDTLTCIDGCLVNRRGENCSEKCPNGKYGTLCNYTCAEGCVPSTCNIDNGTCRCAAGWTVDSNCTEVCPNGTFGFNCNQNCSDTCKHGVCDGINGNCTDGCVEDGLGGRFCSYNCTEFPYAVGCGQQCGHCMPEPEDPNNGCNPLNGTCNDYCDIGYATLPWCKKECLYGYIYACPYDCGRCKGRECDPFTGACPDGCDDRHYGEHCNHTCSVGCTEYGKCDDRSGHCIDGCRRGYSGAKCDKYCAYGPHCEYSCGQCKNGDTCNHVTGYCPNGCEDGFYHETCKYRCSSGCGDRKCDIHSGTCVNGCKKGYHGIKCREYCFYGPTCMWDCGHCDGGELCNNQTGACPSSCAHGYHGTTCDFRDHALEFQLFQVVLPAVFGVVFLGVISFILITYMYQRRKKSQNVDQVVST